MAKRIFSFAWETVGLETPSKWPSSLRSAVGMLLSNSHPGVVLWGRELVCIYNDAFGLTLGYEKHPHILGLPCRQAFSEMWAQIGADIESVLAGGPPVWKENQLVPLWRNGRLEEVYWTYSYAAIEVDGNSTGAGGVLVLCTETTSQVLAAKTAVSQLDSLARLFDSAPVFMCVLQGREHRYELANPAYRRLLAGREVLGRTVLEVAPEVVSQGFIELLDMVFETGQPHTAQSEEIRLLSELSGLVETLRLDYVYQPTRNSEGEVTGIFVVGVDVTERVRTEEALTLREEQLRLAIDAGDVGLWDVDPVADKLYWPTSVRRMFGIFSDRPVTMQDDFGAGLHPDDRELTVAAFKAATDSDVRFPYDVEYRTIGLEDGVVRWVAAKGRGIFDVSGKCVRVIGTAIDITEEKRREARLVELNEKLSQRLTDFVSERKLFADIVEASDALIQVLDTNFRVLANNRANAQEFEHIYGLKPELGDDLLTLISHLPEHARDVRSLWQRAFNGERFTDVQEFGMKERLRRWYEVHLQPLYSPTGEIFGAVQFGYDVTARRHSEARLAEAEKALQQAQRMEVIGLLTGGVAHDFNNVLQALNTKFELIRRLPENAEKVKAWATSGLEAARSGARVTAQLLAFSRTQEAGVRPAPLLVLLENVADLLRTTLGPQIRLHVQCDAHWVRVDPTQFEMALLNLAVNARDAMNGRGTLAIEATAPAQDRDVEIRVADTGAGMSPEVITKAFTPFFTTKAFGKGSGLGLAQVYAMATSAGGSARIESDGRSGTTIVIRLPRADVQTDLADATVQPANPPGRRLKVLVVDDEPAVLASLTELLAGIGHTVLQATSGENALATLAEESVDVLLSDYSMPEMNGVTLSNLARLAHPELETIFMSGYAEVDELQGAIRAGASILRKPFDAASIELALAVSAARLERGFEDRS